MQQQLHDYKNTLQLYNKAEGYFSQASAMSVNI